MPLCPFCSKPVSADAAFCRECGKSLRNIVKCNKCGAVLVAGAKFCNKCGEPAPKTCPQCASTLIFGAKFCNKCGFSLPSTFWIDANICLKCKAPLKPGAKFCTVCGESCEQAKTEAMQVDDESEKQSFNQDIEILQAIVQKKEDTPEQRPEPQIVETVAAPAPPPPKVDGTNTKIPKNFLEDEQSETSFFSKKNLIVCGIAIGVIFIIIITTILSTGDSSPKTETDTTALVSPPPGPEDGEPIEKDEVQSITESLSKPSPAQPEKKDPVKVNPEYWFLQLGAFGEKDGARQLVQFLEEEGIEGTIEERTDETKTLYLVITGKFKTKEIALEYGENELVPRNIKFFPKPFTAISTTPLEHWFQKASTQRLYKSDLYDFSKADLRIIRNSIFARHGYVFQSQDLQDYFSKFEWYSARYTDVNDMLSSLEADNVKTIKEVENSK